MTDAIEIASDVVTAATALAGLILVYVGSVVTGYATYDPQQQHAVRAAFRRRAWIAIVGFLIAILSAACAVLGKWLHNECAASAAIVLLLVALAWAAGTAVASVWEIN
jgi:hypothetical protein